MVASTAYASLVATDASGGLVFSQTQITHDAAGNRTSLLETVTLADGSTAVARLSWAYDGLNRLVRETRDVNDDGVQNQTEADAFGPDYTDTFAFDLNSNRVAYERDLVGTADDLTVASTFDLNDRLLVEDSSDDAEDTSYTYDLNGSQLTETANGETITYGDVVSRPRRTPAPSAANAHPPPDAVEHRGRVRAWAAPTGVHRRGR